MTSHPGMGVMIRQLFGQRSVDPALVIGKVIESVSLSDDDVVSVVFADGGVLTLKDEGQSCCESRYMRTDDDLSYASGSTLMNIEIKSAPDVEEDDGYSTHEVQFLVLTTDKCVLNFASHNEHNGYYGGFSIEPSYEAPEGK